ncbi:MAG: DMT family transporter [Clostridia bacterium]|nr:DMT family transporter [Clostridia bacterium]
MEVFYTLLYAFLIGFYNVFKKFSLRKSGESVVLILFTTTAFLLSLIWIPFGVSIPLKFIPIFALKGFLLALSWYLVLKVLKDVDISVVTVTNLLSAVLSFVLAIIIFNEKAGVWQIVGSAIVLLGVAGINLINRKGSGKTTPLQLIMLIISALITTSSNIIDKYTTTYLNSFQVQFWFLLFAAAFSWIFFSIDCIKQKQFLIKKTDLKNYWIYIVGFLLFIGDFMLFKAYAVPGSQMLTISVLAKFKNIVGILAGIIIFKEKQVWKKILLSLLVVAGVILISVF